MIRLVKWLSKDTNALFGEPKLLLLEDTTITPVVKKDIVAIAHTLDASEYIGICFEEILPMGCTMVDNLEENKYYFFYSPIDGNWLTYDLVRSVLKKMKLSELEKLTITLPNALVLDANEEAQNRMMRAIGVMNDTDTIQWKSFYNTFATLTKADLKEALVLSGQSQTSLWLKYTW